MSAPELVKPLGLGRCHKCASDLCVSGQIVACSVCGDPHPDHPLSIANRAARTPEPTRAYAVVRDAAERPVGEQLVALDKQLATLRKEMADLARQVTMLEQQQALALKQRRAAS